MDDLLREFLTETSESLDTVDNQLVRFEQDPNNAKILDNIFRLVHTIKGTCGFLGLPRLEALAHAAETLMGKFRDGMPVTGQAVTLILTTIDRIKDILGQLEATGSGAGRFRPGPDRRIARGWWRGGMEAMSASASPAQASPGRAGASCRCGSCSREQPGAAGAGSDRCVRAKCPWTNWNAPSAKPPSRFAPPKPAAEPVAAAPEKHPVAAKEAKGRQACGRQDRFRCR